MPSSPEYQREWQRQNRNKVLGYKRKHYAKIKAKRETWERVTANRLEYQRRYVAANREAHNAQSRRWFHLNKEKAKATKRRYAVNNREAMSLARKMGVKIAEARRIIAELDARAEQRRASTSIRQRQTEIRTNPTGSS